MFMIIIVAGIALGTLTMVALLIAVIVMKREDRTPATVRNAPHTVPTALTRRLMGLHVNDAPNPRSSAQAPDHPTGYLVPRPRRGDMPVKGGERR